MSVKYPIDAEIMKRKPHIVAPVKVQSKEVLLYQSLAKLFLKLNWNVKDTVEQRDMID